MLRSPKDALNRIMALTHAWSALRPHKAFSGLTLEQFKEAMRPSLEIRQEISLLEARLLASQRQRDTLDVAALSIVQRIVHTVRGDPEEGEDSEFYEGIGFIRKSDRRSGLTRRRIS